MDTFFHKRKLVAIRIRRFPGGSHPVTPSSAALQLLTLKHKKGHVIKPHRHVPRKRVTRLLQEFLAVIEGAIRVTLFDARGRAFRRVSLRAGEALVILDVAHGVEFLKDSLLYEAKNGPFIDDKRFLEPR